MIKKIQKNNMKIFTGFIILKNSKSCLVLYIKSKNITVEVINNE